MMDNGRTKYSGKRSRKTLVPRRHHEGMHEAGLRSCTLEVHRVYELGTFYKDEGAWQWPPFTDSECLEILYTLPHIHGGQDRIVWRF
ncbi:UNVERIFIED_CONTAM: hypothetical protein Sindi_1708900 [Sesamum indicum]